MHIRCVGRWTRAFSFYVVLYFTVPFDQCSLRVKVTYRAANPSASGGKSHTMGDMREYSKVYKFKVEDPLTVRRGAVPAAALGVLEVASAMQTPVAVSLGLPLPTTSSGFGSGRGGQQPGLVALGSQGYRAGDGF